MSTYHDINVLKDVCTLLHPDLLSNVRGAAGQRENEERRTRMTEWLKKLQESVSYKDAPWDMDDGVDPSRSVKIVPRFINLLRECMLTHRWPQVVRILDCLAHMPEGTDWVVWKAGLTVLYTEPEVNCELIQQFFKQMYLLRELNLRSVVLEFVLYLLTQGMTEEATQVIQESHSIKRGLRAHKQTQHTRYLCELLDAYQGMIFYVDWRQAIHKSTAPQSPSLTESFYEMMQPTEGLSDDAIKQIAARALLGLDQLPEKEGVWDIFLPKAIEIHEYYEEFETARKLLDKYRQKNPDNPNSHRFLYEFLQRNIQHFEYEKDVIQREMISCLKGIAKLDPANPLVLTLSDVLADAGHRQAVVYIFDLLDFYVWKDKPDGWTWLSDYLQRLLLRDESTPTKASLQQVEQCWSIRKDWWPSYHFNPLSLSAKSSESQDQLVAKCIVASVFLGAGCQFCHKARAIMKKEHIQYLDEVLSNMNLELFSNGEGNSPKKRRKSCR